MEQTRVRSGFAQILMLKGRTCDVRFPFNSAAMTLYLVIVSTTSSSSSVHLA